MPAFFIFFSLGVSYVVPGKEKLHYMISIHDRRGREGSVAKVFITVPASGDHFVRQSGRAGRIMLVITTHKLNAIPPSNLDVGKRLRTGVLFRRVSYCTILWIFTSFCLLDCPHRRRRRRQNPRGYDTGSYEYSRA